MLAQQLLVCMGQTNLSHRSGGLTFIQAQDPGSKPQLTSAQAQWRPTTPG